MSGTYLTTGKKYTSGPRYWNVPVLVNTGTFMMYQYCLKMWCLRSLQRAGCIQKLTILERQNGLALSNTRVPVSGTWSILFPTTAIHLLIGWHFYFLHIVWHLHLTVGLSFCALLSEKNCHPTFCKSSLPRDWLPPALRLQKNNWRYGLETFCVCCHSHFYTRLSPKPLK